MPVAAFARFSPAVCTLGESPTWDSKRSGLWWVDIRGQSVFFADSAGCIRIQKTFDSVVASLGLCRSGRLLVALAKSVILWEPQEDISRQLCAIERQMPENRLNDGKVGPDGRFWVGSMHDSAPREARGSLYRVDASGRVERVLDGLRVSNGLAWTQDGRRMCLSDSAAAWIDQFDFDPRSGGVRNRRRLASLSESEGRPDGASFDQADVYWSAGVSAGRINAFDHTGRIIESWNTPVSSPTMCAFGGADAQKMFITSHGLNPVPQPEKVTIEDGALLITDARSPGVLPFEFDDEASA